MLNHTYRDSQFCCQGSRSVLSWLYQTPIELRLVLALMAVMITKSHVVISVSMGITVAVIVVAVVVAGVAVSPLLWFLSSFALTRGRFGSFRSHFSAIAEERASRADIVERELSSSCRWRVWRSIVPPEGVPELFCSRPRSKRGVQPNTVQPVRG
jgi:hypothetical protein